MKCQEAEQRIFLYGELTEQERRETDDHVRCCEFCMQAMERTQALTRITVDHRANPPALPNEAAMTHRIMAAVRQDNRRRSPQVRLRYGFFMPSLRYAMAGLSFVLAISFFMESAGNDDSLALYKRSPVLPGHEPVLNIAAFHSAFFEARSSNQQSTALAKCLTSCLESKEECDRCAKMFSKP